MVDGDVAKAVDGFRKTACSASNQAATLGRTDFASVRQDFEHMSLSKGNQDIAINMTARSVALISPAFQCRESGGMI